MSYHSQWGTTPDAVQHAFRHLQATRVVNQHGFVRLQRFLVYAERGLAHRRVSVYDEHLRVEYDQTLLALALRRIRMGQPPAWDGRLFHRYDDFATHLTAIEITKCGGHIVQSDLIMICTMRETCPPTRIYFPSAFRIRL